MDRDQIEQIKQSVNIVDVVSTYLPLKKRTGSSYVALCPFHEEKTPSFNVNEGKQFFHCFGCGKSGDVIKFVQEIEHISFFDAAKKMAERGGVILEWNNTHKSGAEKKRDLLYTIYRLANDFFKANLQKHGQEAQHYLKTRGLSEKTAQEFDLGYALDSFNGLWKYLKRHDINTDIMLDSGLFGTNERGSYDLFRNRVMFPVHSDTGRIIAFSGRQLDESQPGGKYVNSPTTQLYIKGDVLYGFHRTRYEISKKNAALVVEGNMDLLRLHSEGFFNSVAQLGTALTDKQITLLARFTPNVFLMYDADKGGKAAALKNAANLLRRGLNPRIVRLPDGEDPDTYLLKKGGTALQQAIDSALTLVQFYRQDTTANVNNQQKVEHLINLAQEQKDRINQEMFLAEIATEFGLSKGAVAQKVKPASYATADTNQEQTGNTTKLDLLARYLLRKVLDNPSLVLELDIDSSSGVFNNNLQKELYSQITRLAAANNNLTSSGLLNMLDGKLAQIAGELMLDESPLPEINELLAQVRLRGLQQELMLVDKQLRDSANDTARFQQLLAQKQQIKKRLSEVARNDLSNNRINWF